MNLIIDEISAISRILTKISSLDRAQVPKQIPRQLVRQAPYPLADGTLRLLDQTLERGWTIQ